MKIKISILSQEFNYDKVTVMASNPLGGFPEVEDKRLLEVLDRFVICYIKQLFEKYSETWCPITLEMCLI